MISSDVEPVGNVEMIIDYKSGEQEVTSFPNTVLKNGRRVLALTLANQLGSEFQFYITRMMFGDGGTQGGVKKYVNGSRNGLFGVTRLTKPVLANLDSVIDTQVIFTSVITYDEVIGVVLNEMALQMANGDLYSMVTFSDFTKSAEMQVTFNWRINFI